jgi:FtsP/CotA-like multicopper oxidase with cupredoxin domain/peroxiredoxin
MMCPTDPAKCCAHARIVRFFAAAVLILVGVASAHPDEKVEPAPSLRQAKARFAARHPERRLELKALGPIQTPVPPLETEGNCKVTQDDPMWVDPACIHAPADGSPICLKVEFAISNIASEPVLHRSYNKAIVGPVIRVRPDQKLVVELDNRLPPEPPTPPGHLDAPHGFNSTNLHTHGLHVSPRGDADNVFPEVEPGKHKKFVYPIRADHPAGTFWYHAHKHGSVGLQLSSGMCGALIVEGGIDHYPAFESQSVAEKVMVFEQIVYHKSNDPKVPSEVVPGNIYSTMKQVKPKVTVTVINGQDRPVIKMRPGEVQRWRMVHAGIQTAIDVHLEGHTLSEIALDGIPLHAIRHVPSAKLQPGYRSDVLVKANQNRGVYCLYNWVQDGATAFENRAVDPDILAKVVVEGEPVDESLPDPGEWTRWVDRLYRNSMPELKDIANGEIQGAPRSLQFSHINPRDFTINGQVFDPARIDQRIMLGAVEKWVLTAAPNDNHPFHIHVNPFQVQILYPKDGSSRWVWRDTVLVTPTKPIEIRSRFLDYWGKTVLHCHNLDHEDNGMMETVCIVDPKNPDPDCPATDSSPTKTQGSTTIGRPAPAWVLSGAVGQRLASTEYKGHRLLIVFHRGFECWHCAAQINLLDRAANAFRASGVDVLVVSPRPSADGSPVAPAAKPATWCLLQDPTLDAFRAFGCLAGGKILHGAFLIDSQGVVRWARVGEQPETDIPMILENARKLNRDPVFNRTSFTVPKNQTNQ